jgi:hypothetical protein
LPAKNKIKAFALAAVFETEQYASASHSDRYTFRTAPFVVEFLAVQGKDIEGAFLSGLIIVEEQMNALVLQHFRD